MAKFPFIPTFEVEQAPAETAKVFEFPRDVSLRADLREARRQLERCERNIENDDINSPDTRERVRAACSIPMRDYWHDEVRRAEAAVAMLEADDTLTFRSQMYRAHRSINGAN
ncbi:hypothetical protein [Sphingomonas faeni]|uniref:hypothetical protein n=1 Tax=Sphingomonas faeni TaxID=185950 RepID=UPI003358A8B6